MNLKLGNSFQKKLTSRIEGHEFEIGVLDDKDHRPPVETPLFGMPNLGSYAGGPVRKIDRAGISTKTVGEVFIENQERLGVNMLWEPFEKEGSDIVKFMRAFLKFAVSGKVSIKRVENLLQAIVRNPILRQEYGPNSPSTADMKGFDRHLFDTGQMFKAIRARAKRV